MKKLLILFVVIFSSHIISAKTVLEEVKLKDGSTIIVYNNNTWEYKNNAEKTTDSFKSLNPPANSSKNTSSPISSSGRSTSTKSTNTKTTYSGTCGARTKKGGYCQRKVSGGGYCWQHR